MAFSVKPSQFVITSRSGRPPLTSFYMSAPLPLRLPASAATFSLPGLHRTQLAQRRDFRQLIAFDLAMCADLSNNAARE
jgi:hypothetical protein